jgi:hypothetical protein
MVSEDAPLFNSLTRVNGSDRIDDFVEDNDDDEEDDDDEEEETDKDIGTRFGNGFHGWEGT